MVENKLIHTLVRSYAKWRWPNQSFSDYSYKLLDADEPVTQTNKKIFSNQDWDHNLDDITKFLLTKAGLTQFLDCVGYSQSKGIERFRNKLSKITLRNSKYKKLEFNSEIIEGSESVIYLDPGDDKYVYKLNNPRLKIHSHPFNAYLFNLACQNIFFPKFKYTDFKVESNTGNIFMKQLFADGDPADPYKMISLLKLQGWENAKSIDIPYRVINLNNRSYRLSITDIDYNNVNINSKGVLQVFDPYFTIVEITHD